MAKLDRVLQKIFGSSGGGSEFGQIGSLAAGSPTYSKDLDTIQALTQYLEGLFALTNSGAQPPRIQDINSLYLLFSSQLKYLFQAGVPEWITTEEYYIGSICQVAGVLYTSKTGTSGSPNVGNAVSSATNWKKTLDIGELSGLGANWPATILADLGSDWQTALEAAANTAVKNNNADTVDSKHAADFATATQGAKADTAVQPASISTVARIMSPGDSLIAPPFNSAYVIVTNGSTVTAVTVFQGSLYTVPAGSYAIRLH